MNTFFKLFLICTTLTLCLSANKLKIRVYTIEKDDGVHLYVDNGENFPISLTLTYELENMVREYETKVSVVPPMTNRGLLNIFKTINTSEKFSYDYSWKTYPGDLGVSNYDENFIYELPIPPKGSYLMGQGYNGSSTHRGYSAHALDFQLPKGTKIFAARDGIVTEAIDHHDRGCPEQECEKFENYIAIYQEDGTFSGYAHINQNSAQVKKGDTIKAGQYIARSGATGVATGAHLHYQVFLRTLVNDTLVNVTLPVKFRVNTKGKPEFLREGVYYKRREQE